MKQHDSIMVVVDKLTKTAHFIPVKTTHKETNIAEIYMKEIVRQKSKIYIKFLERIIQRLWDKFKSQYNLSSRLWWENKED